jgi:hypothetical protein
MSAVNFVSMMLEKVRPKLQELQDSHELASSIVKKGGNVINVNERMARIPFVIADGGDDTDAV